MSKRIAQLAATASLAGAMTLIPMAGSAWAGGLGTTFTRAHQGPISIDNGLFRNDEREGNNIFNHQEFNHENFVDFHREHHHKFECHEGFHKGHEEGFGKGHEEGFGERGRCEGGFGKFGGRFGGFHEEDEGFFEHRHRHHFGHHHGFGEEEFGEEREGRFDMNNLFNFFV
jgi:hypothetical protein